MKQAHRAGCALAELDIVSVEQTVIIPSYRAQAPQKAREVLDATAKR